MLIHGILLLVAVVGTLAAIGLLWLADEKSKAVFPGVAAIVALLFSMMLIISPGHARVGVIFGNMDQHVYGPGFHLANPLMGFEDYSTKRIAIEFQSPNGNDAPNTDNLMTQTSDQIALTIDVTFAVQQNAACLPWIYTNVGDEGQVDDTFLRQAARAAVRDSTPQFTLVEAIVTKRQELATTLEHEFAREVTTTLVAQGLSPARAQQCFTFLPVQLRRTEPPRQILDAQAQYAAAQRNLATAGVTVQIQQQLAQARAAEGLGLRNLASGAPPGWTAGGIAAVQNSQANLMLAQAMKTAVDNHNVPIIVTNGGGTTVQVPQGN